MCFALSCPEKKSTMKFVILPMEPLSSEIGQWTRHIDTYERGREKEVWGQRGKIEGGKETN